MPTLRQSSASSPGNNSVDFPLKIATARPHLIHELPCRYRFRFDWIKNQPDRARWIQEKATFQDNRILLAKASSKTGNVLIVSVTPLDVRVMISRMIARREAFVDLVDRKSQLQRSGKSTGLSTRSVTNWHSTTLTKVYEQLGTNDNTGLTASVRQSRLSTSGLNSAYVSTRIEHLRLIREQLFNVPTGMLLGSALLSVVTGGLADAGLILIVVFVNGAVGYKTSVSADRAINSLGEYVRDPVKVLVEGAWQIKHPFNLVPGDIIRIEGGIVPADCLVIASDGLTTDESSLTGESHNCLKYSGVLPEDLPISERHNMLYAGTIATGGIGVAVIVATGHATEIGKITTLTAGTKTRGSLLQRQLDTLGRKTVALASGICVGFFITGLVRGITFLEMARISVSLAVAAIPEGLTAVGTISFAFGIGRMQRKGIYARDLRSIENIGNIHYFCFDKTGTVTANRMVVTQISTSERDYADFDLRDMRTKLNASSDAGLHELMRTAVLCNDADLDEDHDSGDHKGSPTEIALLEFAASLGLEINSTRFALPRVATDYRTFNRRYMATHHQLADDTILIVAKGDPAAVLNICQAHIVRGRITPLSAAAREKILSANSRMADAGLRVLGFASRICGNGTEKDFCWSGLIGISDPPRFGVKNLILDLHRSGIKTMLITGDQLQTAISVAKELGFNGTHNLKSIDARKLNELLPEARHDVIPSMQVFARVSPEEKLIIIKTLQKKGYIVAMTGDGVNDSPALRAADVGVAMGKCGSRAACETADLVISDDRLQTMFDAIIEGRAIRKNLRQATKFLLATNYAEMSSLMSSLLFSGRSVLSPVQLLWVNMITDVFPALALAAEPADPKSGSEQPPEIGSELFTKSEASATVRDSLIMSAFSLPHLIGKSHGPSEFLTTMVTSQMAYAWRLGRKNGATDFKSSGYRNLLLGTLAGSWMVQMVLPYTPGISRLLGLNRMSWSRTIKSLLLGLAPVAITENFNQTLNRRSESRSAKVEEQQ